MRCNWCEKGEGKNYTTDKKTGKTYFYYCSNCIGQIEKELIPKKFVVSIIKDLKTLSPHCDVEKFNRVFRKYKEMIEK